MSRRARWLRLGGIAIVALACGAAFWWVAREQQRLHNVELTQQLLTEARMIRAVVAMQWPLVDGLAAGELVRILARENARIAVLGPDGRVLYDSTGSARTAQLLAAPEVQQALTIGWGVDRRSWGPEQRPHVMAAVAVHEQPSHVLGVIWVARPTWTLAEHPVVLLRMMGMSAVVAALVTVVLVAVFIRLRRRVFRRVIAAARSLSAGELATEIKVTGADELAVLSTALNALRRRMVAQLETIDRQRRMLESLVDHLGEGVVVARDDGRIMLVNPTAMRLLDLGDDPDDRTALLGQPVETCIRPHALQRLLLGPVAGREPDVADAAADELGEPFPSELRLPIETARGTVHVVARVSPLDLADSRSDGPGTVGRVLLLTDVTELERTIQVRTDFVANASHELRTPLATISAAVETLLAMDLHREEAAAVRFLHKIERHAQRLQQMVADLLDLSRLESPAERFEPEEIDVKRFLQDLHFRFAESLEAKGLRWVVRCEPPGTHTIIGNPHLLRLVLDNLVDNAVKFTDPDGEVRVLVRRQDDQAVIEVQDNGCGIPLEDQQRVFERFYQVQRSRSGVQRGTGLGLSIVRHAVGAMQATVQLASELGRGTRVTVTLPQDGPE